MEQEQIVLATATVIVFLEPPLTSTGCRISNMVCFKLKVPMQTFSNGDQSKGVPRIKDYLAYTVPWNRRRLQCVTNTLRIQRHRRSGVMSVNRCLCQKGEDLDLSLSKAYGDLRHHSRRRCCIQKTVFTAILISTLLPSCRHFHSIAPFVTFFSRSQDGPYDLLYNVTSKRICIVNARPWALVKNTTDNDSSK